MVHIVETQYYGLVLHLNIIIAKDDYNFLLKRIVWK